MVLLGWFIYLPALLTAQIQFNQKEGTISVKGLGHYIHSENSPSANAENMVRMNFSDAIKLGNPHGIIADIDPGGWVELAVYSTEKDAQGNLKVGKQIYEGYVNETSATYRIKPMDETIYLDKLDIPTNCKSSLDIACRVQEANIYKEEPCVITKDNGWFTFFRRGPTLKEKIDCSGGKYPLGSKQPVVVRLFISHATVKSIKIPGVSTTDLPSMFDFPFDFKSFAIIGNYGCAQKVGGNTLENVASMINNNMDHWKTKPDFMLSLGNDSYHELSPGICGGTTFDDNVGKFFHNYIKPYSGKHGAESPHVNRFFPVPGQIDYTDSNGNMLANLDGEKKWRSFFSKSTEQVKHYDFVKGDVHFFALNTNNRTGRNPTPIADENSVLAQWLKAKLERSTSKFKIVYFHHPPYASGVTGNNGHSVLRWPFKRWGADIVISGGANFYERHQVNGFTYIVNGTGGRGLTAVPPGNYASTLVGGTHVEQYGAMVVYAMGRDLMFRFQDINGVVLDQFVLFQDGATYYDDRVDHPLPALGQSETTDVFLILGQSNTGGRCNESNTDYGRCPLEAADQGALSNTFLLNEHNRFEAATNPINKYSTVELVPPAWQTVSVGWTFGPKVYQGTNTKVGLISNARGGLRWETWQKNWNTPAKPKSYESFLKVFLKKAYTGENPYREALSRTTNALDHYTNSKVKAILMLQGEWTAAFIWPGGKPTPAQKTALFAQLDGFISDFRNDLKTHTGENSYATMPWFMAELRRDAAASPKHFMKTKEMNKALHEYASTRQHVYIVSSKDLTVNKDGVHYDYRSQKTLGERFAQAYLKTLPSAGNKIAKEKTEVERVEIDEHEHIMIYPNPAEDMLTVRLGNTIVGKVKVEIKTAAGMVLRSWELNSNENSKQHRSSSSFVINDLNKLIPASGLYFVDIASNAGKITKKLIIK